MSWSALAVATLVGVLASTSGSSTRPSASFAATEVARLRAHFDSVDAELRARDVRSLSPAQRAARARHVERLRAYRDRGVFPRNVDFPGRRVAYFVDERGTHCAMAQLIAESGNTVLVERVRATRNHAQIAELASDPALVAWLDSAGLTAGEAARIQPQYEYEERAEARGRAAYVAASAVTGALSATSVVWNLRAGADPRHRGRRVALGLAAGAVSLVIGGANPYETHGVRHVATANTVVGAAAVATAAWALLQAGGETQSAEHGRQRLTEVALAPHVRDGGGGLRVSARF